MRRVIAWAAGIAAMTGVIAAMLMTTVPGDRGRDEINLVTIHELPLASGGELTQPVPLQRASPYDIQLPYHWRGDRPARVHLQLTGADGVLLADSGTEGADRVSGRLAGSRRGSPRGSGLTY